MRVGVSRRSIQAAQGKREWEPRRRGEDGGLRIRFPPKDKSIGGGNRLVSACHFPAAKDFRPFRTVGRNVRCPGGHAPRRPLKVEPRERRRV